MLVNGAGVLRLGPTETLSDDDWHDCMTVNASGVFYLLRALVPHFKGSGAVPSSPSAPTPPMCRACRWRPIAPQGGGHQPDPDGGAGAGPFGVRANLVSPGSTDTPCCAACCQRGGHGPHHCRVAGQFKLGIPLRKVATPAEIAHTVLFLASDLASHITLQDLVVDGGATPECLRLEKQMNNMILLLKQLERQGSSWAERQRPAYLPVEQGGGDAGHRRHHQGPQG